MKKPLFAVLISLICLSAIGQGTIFFGNRNALGTTHVWAGLGGTWPPPTGLAPNDTPSGTADYAGAGYTLIGANGLNGQFGAATTFAQLLGANGANQPDSSLVPMGPTTTFRTGAAAGNIVSMNATLNGIPADSPVATFSLAVWDNSSGLYSTWTQASVAWLTGLIIAGRSPTFNVQSIGGSVNGPPNTFIPTFAIGIPEPSCAALAILGCCVLTIFRRRK